MFKYKIINIEKTKLFSRFIWLFPFLWTASLWGWRVAQGLGVNRRGAQGIGVNWRVAQGLNVPVNWRCLNVNLTAQPGGDSVTMNPTLRQLVF